jgi:hypothetical protein
VTSDSELAVGVSSALPFVVFVAPFAWIERIVE